MNWSLTRPALLLIAVGQLLVSCSKESDKNAPAVQPQSHNAAAYDYLGQQHNDGLDYILKNGTPGKVRSQINDLTVNYALTQGYDEKQAREGIAAPSVQHVISSPDPSQDVRDYYGSKGMATEQAYVDKISDALAKSKTDKEAVANLSAIEDLVGSDKELSPESQAQLLKALAIGRYSARYWYAQWQLGKDSPWKKNFGSTVGSSAGQKPWWAIALADLCGGIIGAGELNPVTIILGAVGTSGLYSLP